MVFPTLPVRAITGILKRSRYFEPISKNALFVSGTYIIRSLSMSFRELTAAFAPFYNTSGTKSFASKRSPRSATNSVFSSTSRLSVEILSIKPERDVLLSQNSAASLTVILSKSNTLFQYTFNYFALVKMYFFFSFNLIGFVALARY